MDTISQPSVKTRLIRGEFAPVYWEPLGRRGERLVVGVVMTGPEGIAQAHITLHHKRLLDFISQGKSESGDGVIRFAFDHFNKTLNAGGVIEDLRAPFASMSIGRTEAVSGRDAEELLSRATRISTLIGHMPDAAPKEHGPDAATARTRGFVRGVREYIRLVDKKLARLTMKHDQFYPVGNSKMRVHFHSDQNYAQFCSLPLPNARVETATECQARLADLLLIRSSSANANVALCVNTTTLEQASKFQGSKNATLAVRQATLDFAKAMNIPVQECHSPKEAASFLRKMANID